jgi:hypothetical protein
MSLLGHHFGLTLPIRYRAAPRMTDAVTSQLPLETLAATIKAHVARGDASIEKAEQHYKAAGIHLMEAKERVMRRKDITWPAFLLQHCGVRRSRADELIAIANGRTSLAEIRESNRRRDSDRRERDREGRSSTVAHGKSSEKTQRNQQPHIYEPANCQEEETLVRDPRAVLISKISAELNGLRLGALETIWAEIQKHRGENQCAA